MDLSTTQQVLLIILGSALAIFVCLGIAIAVVILKLLATIRSITSKAEKVVDSAQAATQILKNVSTPVGILHVVRDLVHAVQNNRSRK